MKVGDVLRQKKSARVVTVRMNETVGVAAQLMRASDISALVVKDVVRTEGNTAVGMFTERDVVRGIAAPLGEDRPLSVDIENVARAIREGKFDEWAIPESLTASVRLNQGVLQ